LGVALIIASFIVASLLSGVGIGVEISRAKVAGIILGAFICRLPPISSLGRGMVSRVVANGGSAAV